MPGVFGCLCQTDCLIGDAINPCTFSKNAFNIETQLGDDVPADGTVFLKFVDAFADLLLKLAD